MIAKVENHSKCFLNECAKKDKKKNHCTVTDLFLGFCALDFFVDVIIFAIVISPVLI